MTQGILKLTIIALCTLTTSNAFAGPGHSHGHEHSHGHKHSHGPSKTPIKQKALSSKELIKAATKNVKAMVSKKHPIDKAPLNASWTKIPEAQKSIFKKGTGYSIIKLEDKTAKKALFVLMSETGELYDANFTGAFKGLEG